jgi:hypothetical protein
LSLRQEADPIVVGEIDNKKSGIGQTGDHKAAIRVQPVSQTGVDQAAKLNYRAGSQYGIDVVLISIFLSQTRLQPINHTVNYQASTSIARI